MITDVVFAYSTAQNAFCCLVGAILNILCPRERRVFQSKLGVSSSNQCNLHHSPHTGHLENKKKGYNLFRTRRIMFCFGIKSCLRVHFLLLAPFKSYLNSPFYNPVNCLLNLIFLTKKTAPSTRNKRTSGQP